ncbi:MULTISPECIES: ZIP family metal transporter [Flavobacterium]|jgi:zinc transporter ZupT|uniref:Zinc transporter ZupT n=2 Tax=Flavobacterium lindanitolerans TaxID=428988 RepID=A0A497U9N7_9FLAO|nr:MULTISPECIES: ZIP family metal transporter [Flavobacterium]THD33780.1 MAG: ZIP family metal transporter [Flavobacterium johnsoniae]KQS47730.1 ZIP family metal transporter [Flavobacterium sp. Leaf359]MBL7869106.1 ZIP family metal transporter [Flavobacterium lindanitolerans]MDQ7960873.1 ZIP family metal transporter [Flavobacterium lindanitolerans]OJX54132.1 MAG: ZIP family metal transporter [Flavobacterium sp. 38-13]
MDHIVPYILPLFSVLIGYAIALFLKPKKKTNLKLLMAFSGSFLLSITVMHLLPEVYEASLHAHHDHDHGHEHSNAIGIFIMLGILFQIILEFFSKGAEHGHVHGHEEMHKMPWLLFISLCIHALLEGFPVSHHHDLALGIAIHHLPIAIILTSFFVNAHLNKTAILLFMVAFAIMTPLGTVLSEYLPFLTAYYTEITAVVIGILFHISSTIIFESSEGHKFNLAKLSMIAIGIVAAYFI